MIKNLLLPHRFKQAGWWLLAADILFFLSLFPIFNYWNLLHWSWSRPLTHAAMIGGMAAVCLIALSREKVEDEYIAALRAQTLTAVIYLFFVLYVVWTIAGILQFIHGSGEIQIRITNIWFVFAVYIVVFNIRIWLLKIRSKTE